MFRTVGLQQNSLLMIGRFGGSTFTPSCDMADVWDSAVWFWQICQCSVFILLLMNHIIRKLSFPLIPSVFLTYVFFLCFVKTKSHFVVELCNPGQPWTLHLHFPGTGVTGVCTLLTLCLHGVSLSKIHCVYHKILVQSQWGVPVCLQVRPRRNGGESQAKRFVP